MGIYIYVPPTLSIILIFFFKIYAGYFEHAITKWSRGRPGEWGNPEVLKTVQSIALDCAVQSNFINSMILAGASLVLLLARGKAQAFLIITSIIYVVVLMALILWVVRFDPGDLVTSGTKIVKVPVSPYSYETRSETRNKIKKATWLDWIIVGMNVLVIIAIAVTENMP